MPLQFSLDDIGDVRGLERVLRQIDQALEEKKAPPASAVDIQALANKLAPLISKELEAQGSAPLNLQSLLPSTGAGLIIEDTHANRLTIYPASNYPVGTAFYETDRTVLYLVMSVAGVSTWQYALGMMSEVYANRPTGLTTADTGFLLAVTDYSHECRWSGALWVILDNDGGTFVDSAIAMGVGYQLCDGTATTYLAPSGGDLVQTAFTTPDEVTAPSGVYHKSIAAYTGTINAATGGGLTGATGDTDLAPTSGNVDVTVPTAAVITGFTNPHGHSAGTLAVDATGQPRNMGVLRYFRR